MPQLDGPRVDNKCFRSSSRVPRSPEDLDLASPVLDAVPGADLVRFGGEQRLGRSGSNAAKAVIRVSSLKTLASSRAGRQASVPQASTPASFLPWATAREDAIRVRPAGTQTTPAAGIDAASMARRCQTPSQNPEAFLFAGQPSCKATGRAGGVAQANTPRGRALVTDGSGTRSAALTRRAVNTSKRAR